MENNLYVTLIRTIKSFHLKACVFELIDYFLKHLLQGFQCFNRSLTIN